jgi:glycosyltransferase involved in cell wall biosynthesis
MEGFGLPPVEAVLRGVPVIAVQNSAATETLEGVAAIVPADADAIAEAMAHPVEPPELAVGEIRERYSIASVARSLADSYRRILA